MSRFCKSHWDELRAKIAERGLDRFVAKGGQEVTKRLAAGGFEPLMFAHNALLENAVHAGGIDVMLGGDESCPLCILIERCPCKKPECPFTTWTTRAADDALEVAKKEGLVGDG